MPSHTELYMNCYEYHPPPHVLQNTMVLSCVVILVCSGGSRESICNCLPTFHAIESLWLLPSVHMCVRG